MSDAEWTRGRPRARMLPLLLLACWVALPGCRTPPDGMVLIPAGEFIMGTDEVDVDQRALEIGFPAPWYEDEHPQRSIFLPAFYIGKFEVTNADYAQFVQASGSPPANWRDGTSPPERAAFPVVFVSWYQAADYCRWRGLRLPTEAEWEKAARGVRGQRYPWGDRFDAELANIPRGPAVVGSVMAVGHYDGGKSPYGVYDMIGNVWEWTDSWYQPYPGNTASNQNFGTTYRVNRGLSFVSIGHLSADQYMETVSIIARASFRSYDYPTSQVGDVGFRCAKTVD